MAHIPLFASFCKILLVKKIFKKSIFCWCPPLHPKPFLNDQLGSGTGPHKKNSGVSRSTFCAEQKMSRKTDFQ